DATLATVPGDPPPPSGGTLAFGIYALQRVDFYTPEGGPGGPLGDPLPGDTLELAEGPDGMMMVLTSPSARTALTVSGISFTQGPVTWMGGWLDGPAPGDTAFVLHACTLGEQVVIEYSASGDTLVLDFLYTTPSLPDTTPARATFVRAKTG